MMLGYDDIIKSLGKDISVFPFREKSIKGDALDLTVSEYAWSLCSGKFWIDAGNKIFVQQPAAGTTACQYSIEEKESAVIDYNKKKYVVVLPNSTTLIETQEVIAVSNRIGGNYHSKVSVVSKGLCHLGTYLEPNYRGHSLIAIQNPGKMPILLSVGQVFLSITFFYLKTSAPGSLLGAPGGRFEILSQCGINLSQEARQDLAEQWKNDPVKISQKMQESESYIRFIKSEKKKRRKKLFAYFNIKNVCILSIIVLIIGGLYYIASLLDSATGSSIWKDRFWNVGCSGIIVSIVMFLLSHIKN